MTESDMLLDKALSAGAGVSKEHYALLQAHVAQIKDHKPGTSVLELEIHSKIDGVQSAPPYKITAALKDGQIHRDVGPAIVIEDIVFDDQVGIKNGKTVMYMKNGKPDRDDGPAVITATGSAIWLKEGQLNRAHGPAAIADGQPVFAVAGVVMSADEFGRQQGLGKHGSDWMVEPTTGTMFTGLTTGHPAVTTMRDAAPQTAQVIQAGEVAIKEPLPAVKEKESPAPPPLTAASDKQRSWGENIRAATVAEIEKLSPDKALTILDVMSKTQEFSNAKFWVGTRDMPVAERAAAVVHAVENPQDKSRMKPFDKYMGVSR